jgi:hypothetical protein
MGPNGEAWVGDGRRMCPAPASDDKRRVALALSSQGTTVRTGDRYAELLGGNVDLPQWHACLRGRVGTIVVLDEQVPKLRQG